METLNFLKSLIPIAFAIIYALLLIFWHYTSKEKIPKYKLRGGILAGIAFVSFLLSFIDDFSFSVMLLLGLLMLYIDLLVVKIYALKDIEDKLLTKEGDANPYSFESKLNNKITHLSKTYDDYKNLTDNLLNHPFYHSKDNFRTTLEDLFQLATTKTIALDFCNDSLDNIAKNGFIKIDVSFEDYTELLCKLTDVVTENITGTYTIRPKKVFEQKDKLDEYIKKLNQAKTRRVQITRQCVFELNEINDILIDHQESGNSEIEELRKFKEEIAATKTQWSSTKMFLKNIEDFKGLKKVIAPHSDNLFMSDFAIFDKELLVLWRENHNQYFTVKEKTGDKIFTGTLILNWNNEVKKLFDRLNGSNLENVKNSFEDLVSFIASKTDSQLSHFGIKKKDDDYKNFETLFESLRSKSD